MKVWITKYALTDGIIEAEEENRVVPKLPVEINKVIYVPIDFKNRIF